MSKKKEIMNKIANQSKANPYECLENIPCEIGVVPTPVFIPPCVINKNYDQWMDNMAAKSIEGILPEEKDIAFDDTTNMLRDNGISFFSRCESFERQSEDILMEEFDKLPDNIFLTPQLQNYDDFIISNTFYNKVMYYIYCAQVELMQYNIRFNIIFKNIDNLANILSRTFSFQLNNCIISLVHAPISMQVRIAMVWAQTFYNTVLWEQIYNVNKPHTDDFYAITNQELYSLTNSLVPVFGNLIEYIVREAIKYNDKRLMPLQDDKSKLPLEE